MRVALRGGPWAPVRAEAAWQSGPDTDAHFCCCHLELVQRFSLCELLCRQRALRGPFALSESFISVWDRYVLQRTHGVHGLSASRVVGKDRYLLSEDGAHDLEPSKVSGVTQKWLETSNSNDAWPVILGLSCCLLLELIGSALLNANMLGLEET